MKKLYVLMFVAVITLAGCGGDALWYVWKNGYGH